MWNLWNANPHQTKLLFFSYSTLSVRADSKECALSFLLCSSRSFSDHTVSHHRTAAARARGRLRVEAMLATRRGLREAAGSRRHA